MQKFPVSQEKGRLEGKSLEIYRLESPQVNQRADPGELAFNPGLHSKRKEVLMKRSYIITIAIYKSYHILSKKPQTLPFLPGTD